MSSGSYLNNLMGRVQHITIEMGNERSDLNKDNVPRPSRLETKRLQGWTIIALLLISAVIMLLCLIIQTNAFTN